MDGWIRGGLPVAQNSQSMGGNTHLGYGSDLMFPSNIWVTLELFIDYTADKVYFSIPSMNFVRVFDTNFFLSLTNPVSPEDPKNDEPVGIHISNSIDIAKVDNFSIEALNQIPLNIQEWVSSKFNVFPNPVTDVVTITNSSNIGIEELTVYDMNAKIVQSKKIKNESELQLNIGNLANGTYLLHIKTSKGVAIKK